MLNGRIPNPGYQTFLPTAIWNSSSELILTLTAWERVGAEGEARGASRSLA